MIDTRRCLDIAIAAAALPLALPVMLLLALAVAWSMGRPVLFVQPRAGRAGRPFRLVKFRSMTDARDTDGRLLPDEARLTRLGRFLRRSRLDELPEIWNILKGEMSLIGPRPLLVETVAAFGDAGWRRAAVRPGLTGWAQVNGNTRLTDAEKLALDLWYIDHRSLALDLAILGRTLMVVLTGERIDGERLAEACSHAHRRYRFG